VHGLLAGVEPGTTHQGQTRRRAGEWPGSAVERAVSWSGGAAGSVGIKGIGGAQPTHGCVEKILNI
jgi:hypothetical protein